MTLMPPLSWTTADRSDDPLEAARDSVFVKILLKLIQEGEKPKAAGFGLCGFIYLQVETELGFFVEIVHLF